MDKQNMENVNRQFNNGIESIWQDVSANDSVIRGLDQIIYRASRQHTTESYQTSPSQLNNLSPSYRKLKTGLRPITTNLKTNTMSITRLGTERRRMSKIVINNGTIYLCGQVAKDAEADISEQTRTMLEKVDELLIEAGSDREHILSATIYIKDMQYFAAMNEVWDNWVIEGHSPARACVQAQMARPELLVEISVIAAVIE
jgi:enamine deaminase RidA (YjgF/YER057c/UK114 family)